VTVLSEPSAGPEIWGCTPVCAVHPTVIAGRVRGIRADGVAGRATMRAGPVCGCGGVERVKRMEYRFVGPERLVE